MTARAFRRRVRSAFEPVLAVWRDLGLDPGEEHRRKIAIAEARVAREAAHRRRELVTNGGAVRQYRLRSNLAPIDVAKLAGSVLVLVAVIAFIVVQMRGGA